MKNGLSIKRNVLFACVALAIYGFASLSAGAQTVSTDNDDSVLKQIILFGRHGIRSNAVPVATIQPFAKTPYPDFGVPPGYLTSHGYQAEYLLGNYFHDYLLHERLLTGDPTTDFARSYFRANSIQRSNISAAALSAALLPDVTPSVHSFALGTPDAVFDPIAGHLVTSIDSDRAVREVQGTFDSGGAIQSAYAAELSLLRSVLLDLPKGIEPPVPTPAGLIDATSLPVPLTASSPITSTAAVINTGGIGTTLLAADPFVMEYANGMPLDQVAWGRLSLAELSQQTRIITLDFQLEMTTPYLNQVQSSNAAAHIIRTLQQAAVGENIPGAFGDKRSRLIVINSSDAYVEGVAGLLGTHWLLPGYQPDYCAPGGNLVFELRESRRTGEEFVRVFYTAQTFDQMRNLSPLTLSEPPATMQLFIPGGSKSKKDLDVDLTTFANLVRKAINEKFVADPNTEIQPKVLTGVPLK